MNRRIGLGTVELCRPPVIISAAAVGGTKEGEGPLGHDFDMIVSDERMGMKSWDMAEGALLRTAAEIAVKKAGLSYCDIACVLAGDLQDQCAAAHYGFRDSSIPFFGLYGACSTMTESVAAAALLVSGGAFPRVLAATSSHFCSAEKQFRMPLSYGGQRAPSAQWTVTGSGAAVVAESGEGPRITMVTPGRIVDRGVRDVNNMGAAMAPAALDTILSFLKDTGMSPADCGLILTGDLGHVGSEILCEFSAREGIDISAYHDDCGKLIYDAGGQDVHAGGSGCGCCASVLCGHMMHRLKNGLLKSVLAVATGALMNPATAAEGESIPAIAHAVFIQGGE